MQRSEQIRANLKEIEALYPSKRRPTVVHVTKTRPISDIEAAYSLGIRDFGENRIDELKEKSDYFFENSVFDIRWHFIGKIQTNKINRLLKIKNLFSLHSIDSLKLLKAIMDRKEHLSSPEIRFFIQVNTSGEVEKSGLSNWEELVELGHYYLSHDHQGLNWEGLMTMSKLRGENFESDARVCFSKLSLMKNKLAQEFDLTKIKLSMGMSSDFKVALEFDSDYLRLGSLIYN